MCAYRLKQALYIVILTQTIINENENQAGLSIYFIYFYFF